jgi:ribosomal protein S18 acetylase RimI-like enzyme
VGIEIRPIDDADPPALARLLAARHAEHRARAPLAPQGDAAGEVADVLAAERRHGAVALRDGGLVGFLVAEIRHTDLWGTHAWVPPAGHASTDPEVIRDLYAALAPDWIEEGARLQFALVPAFTAAMDPWYRLAFAQMQVHAVRPSGGAAPGDSGIRPGGPDDLERVAAELGSVIWDHQRGPATFSGLPARIPHGLAEAWRTAFDEPGAALWLAERGGDLAGYLFLYESHDAPGGRPDATHIGSAAVAAGHRSAGVGRALADHAAVWAEQSGYATITADWRVANLEASRFWPSRGFRPVYHRMARLVGIG